MTFCYMEGTQQQNLSLPQKKKKKKKKLFDSNGPRHVLRADWKRSSTSLFETIARWERKGREGKRPGTATRAPTRQTSLNLPEGPASPSALWATSSTPPFPRETCPRTRQCQREKLEHCFIHRGMAAARGRESRPHSSFRQPHLFFADIAIHQTRSRWAAARRPVVLPECGGRDLDEGARNSKGRRRNYFSGSLRQQTCGMTN